MCPCLGRASWLGHLWSVLVSLFLWTWVGQRSLGDPEYSIPVHSLLLLLVPFLTDCKNEWFPLPLQQPLSHSCVPAVLLSAGQLIGLCSVLPSIPVTTSMTVPSLPALRDVSVGLCPERLCPPVWSQAAMHPWCQPAAGQQSRSAGAMCCWCCLLAHCSAPPHPSWWQWELCGSSTES